MRSLVVVLAAVAWAVAPGARGAFEPAPEPAPSNDPAARQRALREMSVLERQLAACVNLAQYEKALEIVARQIAMAPAWPDPHYNRACALARLGRADEAMAALKKAVELGWSNLRLTLRDPDIKPLRADAAFADILAKVRKNRDALPAEKGEDLEGVKTVERDPDNGLRYRLRMSPDATVGKPQRLIVWMHPSGGSMNRAVERLSTNFNRCGFALLVATRKNMAGWLTSDIEALLDDTVADAGTVPGIDAKRPIVLGFSAGGQAALQWYFAKSGALGGLVLDAAYPAAPGAGGRIVVLKPPAAEEAGKVPILAIVGTKDVGSQIWALAADSWREAGVPLKMSYVAGQPHTWLIRDEQLRLVEEWLGEVAAGGLPKGTLGKPPPAPQGGALPAEPAP